MRIYKEKKDIIIRKMSAMNTNEMNNTAVAEVLTAKQIKAKADYAKKKAKKAMKQQELVVVEKEIRYYVLSNSNLEQVETPPSLDEYEIDCENEIDGATEITYKKIGTDEVGNDVDEESEVEESEEEEETDNYRFNDCEDCGDEFDNEGNPSLKYCENCDDNHPHIPTLVEIAETLAVVEEKVKKVRKAKVVKIRDENTPETAIEKLKREAKEMIAKARAMEKEEKIKQKETPKVNINEIKEKLLLKRTLKRDALSVKIAEMKDESLLLCVEIRKINEEMSEEELIALYKTEKKTGSASANREVREFATTDGTCNLKYAPSNVVMQVEEGKTLASVEYHSRPRIKCCYKECKRTTRRVCVKCEMRQTCQECDVCPSCEEEMM